MIHDIIILLYSAEREKMASDIRKDPKGRKLKAGETYEEKTGRYRYQYQDAAGRRRSVYSWTLTANDTVPKGVNQKYGESLREKERLIQEQIMNGIDTAAGNQSVYMLMKRYTDLKWKDVKETTRNGYRTQLNFMQYDPMGQRRIRDVGPVEAEEWFQQLHDKQGKGYSTLCTLRGILRPAFQMAKRNRWVMDNPFDFPLNKKRYGGSETREALTKKDMRRFLDFVRTDSRFSRYFDGIYILFHTGLRISEFCGLTAEDIDFKEHVIHVRRQLLRLHDGGKMILYIETLKTENGYRAVPMLPDVEETFRKVIANRPKIQEKTVWNEDHTECATGFLWVDRNGNYEVAQHWSNHFRWAAAKFNRIYKEEIPEVSPHVARHTFCSNCAAAGMSPKTLQIIMGHSSIEVTLNVYTHLESGDVRKEFSRVAMGNQYAVYPLDRVPELVAPAGDMADEEPKPNLDEEVQED